MSRKVFKDISGYLVAFGIGVVLSVWYTWPEADSERIQDLEEQVYQYEVERDSLMTEIHKLDYQVLTLMDSVAKKDLFIEQLRESREIIRKDYEKKVEDIRLIPDDSLQYEFDRLYPSRSN